MRPTGLCPRSSAAAQMWAAAERPARTRRRGRNPRRPGRRQSPPRPRAARAARPARRPTGAASTTPMMAARVPHRLARMPSKRNVAFHDGGPGRLLAPRRTCSSMRVAGWCRGVTVNRNSAPSRHAGRHGHVHLVAQHLGAGAGARRQSSVHDSPRPPQVAADAAAPARRAAAWRPAGPRTATGECDVTSGVERSPATNALRIRSTAGAIDGKSMATSSPNQRASSRGVVGGAHDDRIAAGRTQRHPCHGPAGTIGAGPGEVNGRTRLPDVRRDDAVDRKAGHRARAGHTADRGGEDP